MALESATTINQLVPANPTHTDGIGQADSHLRLIKSTLQATFPNVSGSISAGSTDLSNGFVPVGGIIMWSGAVTAVPANWALCNGQTVTTTSGSVVVANLEGQFIVGAGGSYSVGASGGAATASFTATTSAVDVSGSTNSTGSHSHGASTGSYTLTTNDMPSHNHTLVSTTPGTYQLISLYANIGSGGTATGGTQIEGQGSGPASAYSGTVTGNAGGTGGSHTHSIGSDGIHSHTFDAGTHSHTVGATVSTIPPYYALAFIQRVT